jgi:hypothetical protein
MGTEAAIREAIYSRSHEAIEVEGRGREVFAQGVPVAEDFGMLGHENSPHLETQPY